MDSAFAVAVLVLIAFIAANLPFLTRRILFVFNANAANTVDAANPAGPADKSFPWRLLEVVLLYVLVGLLARGLESRAGEIYPQGWQFYAITFCLFLVLAYPGFVYRYLWKRHSR